MHTYKEKEEWKVKDIFDYAVEEYKISEKTANEEKDNIKKEIKRKLQKGDENSRWKQYEVIVEKDDNRPDKKSRTIHIFPREIAEQLCKVEMNDYLSKLSDDEDIRNDLSNKEYEKKVQEYITNKHAIEKEVMRSIQDEAIYYSSDINKEIIEKKRITTMIEAIYRKFYESFDYEKMERDYSICQDGEENDEIDKRFFESDKRLSNPCESMSLT